MTNTTQVRPARNGVDVPTLFATLDAVKGAPQIADFQFRATQRMDQRHAQPHTIQGFYGAGQEDTSRTEPFTYDADHPAVLVGNNNGPTPVEFLLHAIAACLTSGLANIAAARGVTLHRVRSTVEGDIDLLGILGLSDDVRNGYRQIRVSFEVEGDATAEELAALVEQSRRRSAVYDVLVNGTDVVDRRRPRPARTDRPDRARVAARATGRPRPEPAHRSTETARSKAMSHTDVVVIGAGQAGLAVSRLLTDRGVDHVVLERGRTAERWRSQRWDSLRLLTPNWMTPPSRLVLPRQRPGRVHAGARGRRIPRRTTPSSFAAPVCTGADVVVGAPTRRAGYLVESHRGRLAPRGVVIATGACQRAAGARLAGAAASRRSSS